MRFRDADFSFDKMPGIRPRQTYNKYTPDHGLGPLMGPKNDNPQPSPKPRTNLDSVSVELPGYINAADHPKTGRSFYDDDVISLSSGKAAGKAYGLRIETVVPLSASQTRDTFVVKFEYSIASVRANHHRGNVTFEDVIRKGYHQLPLNGPGAGKAERKVAHWLQAQIHGVGACPNLELYQMFPPKRHKKHHSSIYGRPVRQKSEAMRRVEELLSRRSY